MAKQHLNYSQIQSILEIARLAPSVHNTQPWLAKSSQDGFVISIDPNHSLTDGDPTGRQAIISLGIFAEAVGIGAIELGLEIAEAVLINKEVHLSFQDLPKAESNNNITQLLRQRCSDRSIYEPVAITADLVGLLEQTATSGISVRVMQERGFIQTVANLTSKGIQLALSSPGFRAELSRYLVLPWSRKRRGISVKSLHIAPVLAVLQPLMLRLGIGTKAEAKLEKKRWESSSAVVAIAGKGDLERYWFEAGRTYLRASLAIQQAGLAQATSAALVEASNYHEDIEALLKTNERLLSVMRIGVSSAKKQYSPRVHVEDILTSS